MFISARSHGGELTPEQLAAAARASGLDFIAITEHNTADTHGAWGQLAGNDLLVILGQEATTQTGHWLALGLGPGQVIEWRYGVRHDMIDRYVSQVHQAGGLCVAAHPHAPYPGGIFMYSFDGFDAVEVWNGLWSSDRPWNADNNAAVAEWGRALAVGIREPPGELRSASSSAMALNLVALPGGSTARLASNQAGNDRHRHSGGSGAPSTQPRHAGQGLVTVIVTKTPRNELNVARQAETA